jgi:hypothetical protein
MTLEEAFTLMNNLDVREALGKYAPQHSNVIVDSSGVILDVVRHKEQPTPIKDHDDLKQYPKAIMFPSWPGRFSSITELADWVQEAVRLTKMY